jgi:hypothetical protein
MKFFEIWTMGSADTHPFFHGIGYGKNFKEACINYFTSNDPDNYFNEEFLTYWGEPLQSKNIMKTLYKLFY